MTTEIGKFVIDDGQQDLVTIVDVASAAAFNGVIVHALREGLRVTYQRPGEILQIKSPAPATAQPVESVAPKAQSPSVRVVKAVRRRAGKRRVKKVQPMSAAPTTPATNSAAEQATKKTWKQGDVVFIAWRALTEAERKTFDGIREAMGTVEAFRRGQGIRRTIGVKWDTRSAIEWHHPNDLSAICEYCHDERGLDEDGQSEKTEEAGELMAAGA